MSSPFQFAGPVSLPANPTTNLGAATKQYVDTRITVGSGTAGRPSSPVAGQEYFRTDKNFLEIYDGSAWRVQGTVVVSATSDITNPYTGQQVINSGDNYRVWIYNGTSWVLYNALSRVGGEWKSNSAQNLVVGATKIQFPTVSQTLSGDLTYNGTDTWTTGSDGLYAWDCQLRVSAAISCGVALSGTTYADGTLLAGPKTNGSNGWGDVGNGGVIWLAASTSVCAWFYNNSAGAVSIANTTRPAVMRLWKINASA